MRTSLAGLLVALLTLSTPSFANEPAPLSAYGDLPSVEDMAISHNGNRIAAISRIKQERQLLVTENGSLISATPIGDMKVRGLDWAGDEIIVLEKSDSYDLPFGFTATKAELFSAIALKVASKQHKVIFADSPSLSRAVYGSYGLRKIAGRWSGYFAGIKYKRSPDRTQWDFDHGRPFLFAVDLETNQPKQVAGAAKEG